MCVLTLGLSIPRANALVPGIIIDQDMSSDHDDVGDLAVLNSLADLGECRILACMADSLNGATPLCQSAICTYYGRPDVPCGVRPDVQGMGGYPANIAAEFPHPLYKTTADCPHAVDLYRKILASQPDHSVSIVTTGFLNNLASLLQSGSDGYSPLNGVGLVREKVKLLSCAGGCYPNGNEFNFRVEPAASHYVINNWPAPAMFDGYDIGQAIYSGGELQLTGTDNPIRRGWELTFWGPYPTWAQIMVYYAVRTTESQSLWNYVAVGRNNVDTTGSNCWTATPNPGNQGYFLEIQRYPIQTAIDALVMDSGAPKSKGTVSPPNQPSNLRAVVVGADEIDLQWTSNSWNEDGFAIERKINGVFKQIGTVGPRTTHYADTGLSSTANVAYRVKAFNSLGGSAYYPLTVYSGWTEINFNKATDLPLYTYYQYDNLRWARSNDGAANHVVLNNDSNHGQDVTINVEVGSLITGGGPFYVYFFYQDQKNWYRLNVGGTSSQFEKSINGTINRIGSAGSGAPNIGNGSLLQKWQVVASHTGTLQFINGGSLILNVSDTFSFNSGKIGLGGVNQTPVWQNFSFDLTSGGGGSAPATPPGLVATARNTQVTLAWVPSPGAPTYNVYRGTSAGVENTTPIVEGIAGNTYTDPGLANGTTYYYKVTAANYYGKSGYSNEVSAAPTSEGGSPPPAPVRLAATPGNTQAILSWAAASGAASYNVYRSTNSGGESGTPIATSITSTTFTDTGLTNGAAYYYEVTALNDHGTSGYSKEAVVTPSSHGSVPGAPSKLSAAAGNAQVSLTWTAASHASTYNLYRGAISGSEGTTPVATGITGASYTDAGVTNGATYYYKVAAVNSYGASAYSHEANATPDATNAFANPSFEVPSVNGFSSTPDGASWTFTNNAGIQANGSVYGAAKAPDGVQTALLQGNAGTLGTMSQSVSFTAGTYTISFYEAQRFGQVQPIQVSVDGTTVGTYLPESNTFKQITTAPFTVTGGSHTITFAATDSSGDKTSFVDLPNIQPVRKHRPGSPQQPNP